MYLNVLAFQMTRFVQFVTILHNLKDVKSTHRGVIFLVKLHALALQLY